MGYYNERGNEKKGRRLEWPKRADRSILSMWSCVAYSFHRSLAGFSRFEIYGDTLSHPKREINSSQLKTELSCRLSHTIVKKKKEPRETHTSVTASDSDQGLDSIVSRDL
ncbi:hypothetical protein EXN66_Car007621 [Channa argus]|uniref:Uncharacterized protein n=1 Tax=Channa argus TaxID=215402 RepID=A0A6G1PPM2_CHAAH|nr:hypothetical protein EXN66_Car007621 [Channa argus]